MYSIIQPLFKKHFICVYIHIYKCTFPKKGMRGKFLHLYWLTFSFFNKEHICFKILKVGEGGEGARGKGEEGSGGRGAVKVNLCL